MILRSGTKGPPEATRRDVYMTWNVVKLSQDSSGETKLLLSRINTKWVGMWGVWGIGLSTTRPSLSHVLLCGCKQQILSNLYIRSLIYGNLKIYNIYTIKIYNLSTLYKGLSTLAIKGSYWHRIWSLGRNYIDSLTSRKEGFLLTGISYICLQLLCSASKV